MELSPYLETLQRELHAAAAPGGPEVTRTAEQLTGALDAAARLCLLEALSDAAAEITSKLGTASVEVRLRGRDADFSVTRVTEPTDTLQDRFGPPGPPTPPGAPDAGDVTRLTLRLPEPLKGQVDQAAAAE